MKKFIFILMMTVLAIACENRYDFKYEINYSVDGVEYTETGLVVADDAHSVPIAVVMNNGLVVDTYPKGSNEYKSNKRVHQMVYQGNRPVKINNFEYSLVKTYKYNVVTWDEFEVRRSPQSKESNEQ